MMKNSVKSTLAFVLLTSFCCTTSIWAQSTQWDEKLLKDFGGAREVLYESGFSLDLDVNYTLQHVFHGGLESQTNLNTFNDTEHLVSSEGIIQFDTTKAQLWKGGLFRFAVEGRTGKAVNNKVGYLVNNDALFPAVENREGESVLAVTELTYMQFFSQRFAIVAGLLNTTEGDKNDFAGFARSNEHFLNSTFLWNLTTAASVPDVTLGLGAVFILSPEFMGTFSVFNTQGSAGFNPFDKDQGTTFSTEWNISHAIEGLPGKQNFSALYSKNKSRLAILEDPRLFLISLLANQSPLTTQESTWAVYYSLQQYLHGDANNGWGLFIRAGFSDGNPNPVKSQVSLGLGGTGLLFNRCQDRFGIGLYRLYLSKKGLLDRLDVKDSSGIEAFYNVAVTPWLHITGDIQYIDSPLPNVRNSFIGGIRSRLIL